jgi:hypothetical protein
MVDGKCFGRWFGVSLHLGGDGMDGRDINDL